MREGGSFGSDGDCYYYRNPAVIKFQYPRVSLGNRPLAKEPEDSWYEIANTFELLNHLNKEFYFFPRGHGN